MESGEVKRKIPLEEADSIKKPKISGEESHSNLESVSKDIEKIFKIEDDDEESIEKYKEANSSINSYLKTLFEKTEPNNQDPEFHQELIQPLTDAINRILSNFKDFLVQKHFRQLFDFHKEEIEKLKNLQDIIETHKDLLKELTRLSLPQSSNDSKQKLTEKEIYSVKILTKLIARSLCRIEKAQSKELSLDDLDNDTEFTQLPQLYKTVVRLWRLREQTLKRSTSTGQILFGTFKYNGTENEILNKIVENYFKIYLNQLRKNANLDLVKRIKFKGKFNKKKSSTDTSFFTISDLKKKLTEEIGNNSELKNFQLTDQILEKIYKDLLLTMRERRNELHNEELRFIEFSEHIKPENMVDENDPRISEILKTSELEGRKALENVVKEYHKKDLEKNGPDECLNNKGYDDCDDDDSDGDDNEEEEEEEEEDADDEDSNEVQQIEDSVIEIKKNLPELIELDSDESSNDDDDHGNVTIRNSINKNNGTNEPSVITLSSDMNSTKNNNGKIEPEVITLSSDSE